MQISILGAGAMGAAYAAKLAEVGTVAFVAEGKRRERLLSEGVTVNGKHYALPVRAVDDTAPPDDLIMVAVKQHHLAESIPLLKNRVGDDTVILSVMNGLDSEPMLAEAYGAEKVLYAISVGIDAQRDGSTINYSKIGLVYFGEADNTTPSETVTRIQSLFDRAGIPYKTPEDMIRMMWWKVMVNAGINQPSAVLDAPYGVFQTSPHAQHLMEMTMREVVAVAQAENVNLKESDIADWYDVLKTLHPEGRTSMLQDVNAGRQTEVDIFAGKIMALGQKHNIPTPVNAVLYHAIKTIEWQS